MNMLQLPTTGADMAPRALPLSLGAEAVVLAAVVLTGGRVAVASGGVAILTPTSVECSRFVTTCRQMSSDSSLYVPICLAPRVTSS
jgi:hypothetical protein